MPTDFRNDPHAHVVHKPVVSLRKEKVARPDPFVRAENEDDDGYDPYSDRPAERDPLFERDPWS